MKLFRIDAETVRDGTYTGYLVESNEEKALDRFYKIHEDVNFYTSIVCEIEEIDGYKVIFKKGKKISLEK